VTQKFGTPAGNVNAQAVNVRMVGGVLVGAPGSDLVDIAGGINAQRIIAEGYVFNTVTANWERLRTPAIQKGLRTQGLNASLTGIWTPQAGKRFRLMAFRMVLSGDAALAVATRVNFTLQDGATSIWPTAGEDVNIPAASGTLAALWQTNWIVFPGNGYLSLAANNLLNIANPGAAAALTVGWFTIQCMGTEE
jgi:hypothetical protein